MNSAMNAATSYRGGRAMDKIPSNIVSNRMAYMDSNGKPLAYGRLMIYNAGSSTSLALVYADAGLAQLLDNPVLLDSSG